MDTETKKAQAIDRAWQRIRKDFVPALAKSTFDKREKAIKAVLLEELKDV